MAKKKVGRPAIITPEIISKLEEVFSIGGSDEEACFYADIGKTTLYNYQQEHPEFVERKEALKERPVLKARQTVVKALENPQHAQWFLSRKRKKEFSERIEQTGADGEKIAPLVVVNYGDIKPPIQTEGVSDTPTESV